MSMIKWTEVGRKQLEARVYCNHCKRSNVITGYDNPFFFSSFKDRPVKIQSCDHCRAIMRIKISKDGIEHLA